MTLEQKILDFILVALCWAVVARIFYVATTPSEDE